ncbi:MAG TPA: hypothetical protein VFC63_28635 [Blastocatellia bacterium]|nr:hypothetical protein [Blastocatellia bacterium]
MKKFLSEFLQAAGLVAFLFITTAPPQTLPSRWEGDWKGDSKLTWVNGKIEDCAVELRISSIPNSNAKAWHLVYAFSDRKEVRDYELKPVDGSPGLFVIDEKNGFLIDNRLIDNAFYSQFTINGNLVTTRFELQRDTILVENTMFDIKNPRVTKLTGGQFEVSSFGMKYIQRGTFIRQK